VWKDAYLESRILAASPIELVNILYEYAVRHIQDARMHLAAKDIRSRVKSINMAISIIGELLGSLDLKAGGAIAVRLESLYLYMQRRLVDANMKQQDEPLAEVESLMRELGEAWSNIGAPSQTETLHTDEVPYVAEAEDVPHSAFATHAQFESSASCWNA
jgi:flagellar secretion chaperone FliS